MGHQKKIVVKYGLHWRKSQGSNPTRCLWNLYDKKTKLLPLTKVKDPVKDWSKQAVLNWRQIHSLSMVDKQIQDSFTNQTKNALNWIVF